MIEALVISVNEPQLPRCLESVKEQTIPFDNIIHIENTVPVAKAFQEGFSRAKQEWVMTVAGDMILYKDATLNVLKKIRKYRKYKVWGFMFGLFDPFIDQVISSCSIYKTEMAKSVAWHDTLGTDRKAMHEMRAKGWVTKRYSRVNGRCIVIGTHFDNPDEFQIFRRFFIMAIKRYKFLPILENLYEKTGDPRYDLAIRTTEFGFSKRRRSYPMSHDINYDRKIFEEFKDANLNYNSCA